MTITSVKDIGVLVREHRRRLNLTHKSLAALCNVGARFVFDLENGKPSIHFDMALIVLGRLGIRLEATSVATAPDPQVASSLPGSLARGVQKAPATDLGQSSDAVLKPSSVRHFMLKAPQYVEDEWLAARGIALLAAKECGLKMCEQRIDKAESRILFSRSSSAVPLIGTFEQPAKREEFGGPGIKDIFAAIASRSSYPVLDVQDALRWALFSYLIADVSVSAASLRFDTETSRLAPFEIMGCASGQIAAEHGLKGLRIGGEWPSEWLRVDHWTNFAELTGVKAQVVIEMMDKMSVTVPAAIGTAIAQYGGGAFLRGVTSTIANVVQTRATRIRELRLSASHQGVTGIARKPSGSTFG